MDQMQDIGRFVADGYSFYTEKDAALAESELRKVQYLEEHLDYSKPESILRVYNKVVEEQVFKSPVGHFFLKKLQVYLLGRPQINADEVRAIPLHVSYDGEFRQQANPARSRVKPAPEPKPQNKPGYIFSVVLNIILVITVLAMFFIALNADQPNIINYEREITNRYAGWEQELTERERVVREKERELNIAP